MKPFWRHPVRLDNARLVAFLGAEPRTPLDLAVTTTLDALGVPRGRAAPASVPGAGLARSVLS